MEKLLLKNNINLIFENAPNTARIALTCYVDIVIPEKVPGLYSVLSRLFLQGTKNYNSEQLAYEIEKNALELYAEMKSDYWKFTLVCLREDFDTAVSLLADIMQNSTLEMFDKEIIKQKGEITASLDSPTVLARDNFVKNIYKNHQYGNTGTVILENIDKISKTDVEEAYEKIFKPAKKIFTVVGDISKEDTVEVLDKYFSQLDSKEELSVVGSAKLTGKNIVKIAKNDANQAQIYQGWFVPTLKSEDSAAISVMNTILGSSGLSSRLFLELRDKKGLAYTVRSIYNKARHNGDFRVYIATEPKNIKVSLEGFKVEIDKLKKEPVSEKELFDAKNNIIGKVQFITETNLQKAYSMSLYEMEGLGFDYLAKWIEDIKKVSAQDIQRVATKYLNDEYVLMVLAPEKYLKDL